MKTIAFVILTTIVSPVLAQVGNSCPTYQALKGTEIQFSTDEKYKQRGWPWIKESQDYSEYKGTPYDVLAGKKGKIFNTKKEPHSAFTIHEIQLETCQVVYWQDLDGLVTKKDETVGFVFIDQPPTPWKSHTKTNPMDDTVSCIIDANYLKPSPIIILGDYGSIYLGAYGSDFPGRPLTYRIDKNKAISGNDGIRGANANAVIAQIRAGGKTLLVSGYNWPNDYPVINEFNLNGLVEQLNSCKAQLKSK